MAINSKLKRGFTLVELMIVVAIIGVLAALAIYGVQRYVATSKTAEATNALGAIARSVGMAYDREGMAGEVLALGTTAARSNKICQSDAPVATNVVPTQPTSIQGQKYQSDPGEWNGAWECMRFSIKDPQYFQYTYTATGGGTTADSMFTAIANGDLDGDGTLSTFRNTATLQTGTNGALALTVSPKVEEIDELE